ncbi:MAG: hypothetical protein GY930_07270 [bacterium]|nr:hypothetical protein [bacterium]
MRAQVRRLHTPDADDLASFAPEDDGDFALLVQIIAGPEGADGEESFDLEVITPRELARRVEGSGPMSGRHLLIVNRFDADHIAAWIDKSVAACSGGSWVEVAEQLGRIGHWEFEDYRR